MLNYPRLSELPDFVPAVPADAPSFSDYRRAAFPVASACDDLRQHVCRLAASHAPPVPADQHRTVAATVLEKAHMDVT